MTGGDMIREAIEAKKNRLHDSKLELDKARRVVANLDELCAGLANEICQLEQDDKALTRGHVSLMCERT